MLYRFLGDLFGDNHYEFTLVYKLSGSLVPLIRPVCVIPFGRRFRGN